MANVGDLKVLLTADDKASATVKGAGTNIRTTAMNIGKSYAILGGVIAGVFGVSMKSFIDTGDKLDKMSRQTLISVESLEKLHYIANLSGTSLESMNTMILKMKLNMDMAVEGTGPAVESFEMLGITLEEMANAKNEEMFFKLVEAMAEMTSEEERMTTAMNIFGKRMGTMILPMVDGGIKAFNDMSKEAEQNARFTKEMASEAAILADKIFALKTQVSKASMEFAEKLIPMMDKFIEGSQKIITAGTVMTKLFGDNLPMAIVASVVAFKTLKAIMLVVTAQATLMTGGLNLLFGLLALGVTWALTTENAFKKMGNVLIKVVNGLAFGFEAFVNGTIHSLNGLIKAFNIVAGAMGLKLLPEIKLIKIARMELFKFTSKAQDQEIKQNAILSEQAILDDMVIQNITAKTQVMEDFDDVLNQNTDSTKKATKANAENTGSVLALGSALSGLSRVSGGTGPSMAEVMGSFPSLHSAGAQSAYNNAISRILTGQSGAGFSGDVSMEDIMNWRKKHGAFRADSTAGAGGGAFEIKNINTVTSSGVTKLLNESKKRGMGSEM